MAVIDEMVGQLQLVDEIRRRLEVLVPWDVRQSIVWAANSTLKEDHSESSL